MAAEFRKQEASPMDELVKLVSQKAGITEQQAQTAVTTVLDFVKQKLPPQLASQVDGVVSGKTDLSGLGGLFGQK
jgi:hypothetical protein